MDWTSSSWKQITQQAINIYELHLEAFIANDIQDDYVDFFLAQIELFEKVLSEPYNPSFSSITIVLENFTKQNQLCYDGYTRNLWVS